MWSNTYTYDVIFMPFIEYDALKNPIATGNTAIFAITIAPLLYRHFRVSN